MKMSKASAAVLIALALSACGDRQDHDAGDGVSGASGQADPSVGDNAPPADPTQPGGTPAPGTPAASSTTTPDGALASGADPMVTGGTQDASATSGGNDGELLGVLAAINQHEIDAANQAKQHKLPADVAKFADMMLADHRANLDKTQALGANLQAPKAAAQADKGKQDLQKLGGTADAQYAKAYVDAMVKGHTEALAALDDQLIPAAQAGPVKTHLQDTRAKVAEHLEHAKALQAGK